MNAVSRYGTFVVLAFMTTRGAAQAGGQDVQDLPAPNEMTVWQARRFLPRGANERIWHVTARINDESIVFVSGGHQYTVDLKTLDPVAVRCTSTPRGKGDTSFAC